MAVTYEPIATTTLGTAASSITFSSIAASWTDLKLVFVVQNSVSNTLNLRLNNDSSSAYSYTQLGGDGSSIYSARSNNQNQIQIGYGSGMPTSPNWGLYSFNIFSYTGSVNKTIYTEMSVDKNGSGETNRNVGVWLSTSTVNRIDLLANAGSFAIGTTATLYGILKA